MTRRGTPEADLQRAVVAALRFALPKGAIIHHCSNEVTQPGPRGATRQAILVGTPASAGGAMANAGGGRRDGQATRQDQQPRRAEAVSAGDPVADPGSAELEGQQPGQRDPGRWQIPDGYPALPGGAGLHPPGPGDHVAWAAILAARPDLAPALGFDDCLAWARRVSAHPEGPGAAAAEPALRRMADGLAHRARALRLLGNGVHPLAAAHAWRALAAAHGLGPVDLADHRGTGSPSADGPV